MKQISDNPYCKVCKRKFCYQKKEFKDSVKDRDLALEASTIQYLSTIWGIELKQTQHKYCPMDFYSPDIPLTGDITAPNRRWMRPIVGKWPTPGWVIENFKFSTLMDSVGCVGHLSFYVWAFEDTVKILSAMDISKKCQDTMYDNLTIGANLHKQDESPSMPRNKGIFLHPLRMEDPEYYIPDVKKVVNHQKLNEVISSVEDLEREDY